MPRVPPLLVMAAALDPAALPSIYSGRPLATLNTSQPGSSQRHGWTFGWSCQRGRPTLQHSVLSGRSTAVTAAPGAAPVRGVGRAEGISPAVACGSIPWLVCECVLRGVCLALPPCASALTLQPRLSPNPCAVALYGGRAAGGNESDSDESITSPEFRPAGELALPSPADAAGGGAAGPSGAAAAGQDAASPSAAAEPTCAERMAAIRARREAAAARLARLLATLGEEERAAKQQRQQAAADGAALAARIAELQAEEERAVEREDYEAAAALSSEQEAAHASLAAAQQQQHAADAALRSTAEQHLGLVQAQAEAALAAAAALQALLQSQQREAAAAGEHAARAARSAAAAEAAARERLQQLAEREAELQASIERKQAELSSRQQQEEAQLAEQQQRLSAAHAGLQAEVDALRWVGLHFLLPDTTIWDVPTGLTHAGHLCCRGMALHGRQFASLRWVLTPAAAVTLPQGRPGSQGSRAAGQPAAAARGGRRHCRPPAALCRGSR